MRALVVVLLAAAGCMLPGAHILPPAEPVAIQQAPPPPTGSLWHPEQAANYPLTDLRAHFPGELLTVVISEASTGKKDASTATKASSSIAANVQDFFGLPASLFKFLPSGFNPASVVKAETDRSSSGDGTTSRDGTLTANITVHVVSVDAAGNLYIKGDKIVGVNREDQHIVLTGIVRPDDIASDNSVASSRIADARIDYYGRGTVGDKQGTPIVQRLMDWVWPF